MCGIVGYIGKNIASPILIDGLKRLEYRGYDSAGVAIRDGERFNVIKKTGRVNNLASAVQRKQPRGTMGISHTRWATHGSVTEANAHPHVSCDGKIAMVHNGVIENYRSMKQFLLGKGYTFTSETDTEVLCNLIAYHYAKEPEQEGKNRFVESVRKALLHVQGTYGIAVICTEHKDVLVGARKGSPLIIGVGDEENLLASDVAAFARHTQRVVYMNDNEVAFITPDNFTLFTITDEDVEAIIHQVDWEIEDSEIGEYEHFMEKEIMEQPAALENAMRGRFSDDESTSHFGGLNISAQDLRRTDRFLLCACGTAWHSCLVAEYLIERFARLPVEVEYASEFRYRNAPLDKETLVLVVSQSGETIDTLAALREAKRKGYRTLAITNVVGSTIARETDGGIYQHAGQEIGVASTKAFTSQLLISSMLALHLGRLRDLSFEDGRNYVQALKAVPEQVTTLLQQKDHIREIAKRYAHYEDFLFLGRQSMFPIALEGALKLKEISYIHAEGYPAAEMKHGPIALVSEKCPSVVLTTKGEMMHKTLANMQEIRARGGPVILVGPRCDDYPDDIQENYIALPDCHDAVAPLLATIPLQLLAYYIAVERGCDVDKPRNLAKSVTVE